MNSINRISLGLMFTLLINCAPLGAQEATAGEHDLHLSPGSLELLRAEMRALLGGIQSLPAGIATADWKGVAETGARIRSSYILDQKITPAQRQELGSSLPDYFKRLDSDFHLEAGKLESAAINHDAQLAAFHYYRLIEACTVCHAKYALSRFPGFAPGVIGGHGH